MKSLGYDQLSKMTFERLEIADEFKDVFGDLPTVFAILIDGPSSNGKTAFGLLVAKELARHKKAEWVEYESGFAADIQKDAIRTDMKGKPITFTDPWAGGDALPIYPPDMPVTKNALGNKCLAELIAKMAKPKSAHFWFINSIDASRFSSDQVLYIIRKFSKRKGLFFIGLTEGKRARKAATQEAFEQCQAVITVNHFIAQATRKNRFQGWGPFIVNEEKARERNPLFFEQASMKAEPVKQKTKKKAVKKAGV